ncbi:hypothetical protein NNO_1840 [Hydrogenimonas sp.]|nr:hypothetical protein NNO_1840 [Hydrogenimonas sp.]
MNRPTLYRPKLHERMKRQSNAASADTLSGTISVSVFVQ